MTTVPDSTNSSQEKTKTICRVEHNAQNPFVMLNKKTIWNTKLSLRATGLWARCMSRPDNWSFNMRELISKSKEGKEAVYSTMNELIAHNYVLRLQFKKKNSNGKYAMVYTEYIFFEEPITEEDKQRKEDDFKKSFRHAGFQDAGCQDTANTPLLIQKDTDTDTDTEKESRKKKQPGASPPPTAPPPNPKKYRSSKKESLPSKATEQHGEYVWLKKGEYEELSESIGLELVDYYIASINDWVANNKPKKDYAATIRAWHRKDVANGTIPTTLVSKAVKSESEQEKIFKNRKLCEYAEQKLYHLFSSNVYFQAQPTKAVLVNTNKYLEKSFEYDKYPYQELKTLLMNELGNAFPGAREALGKQKEGTPPQGEEVLGMINNLSKTMRMKHK